MQRILRLAAVAALCALPAVAQAQIGPTRVKFGVLVGSSIASIDAADNIIVDVLSAGFDKKRRVGLDAGIFVNIPFTDMLSLQPEVHYAQKGVTITGASAVVGNSSAEGSLKIDYAEVPVLLRLDLGSKTMAFRPILLGGASFALRTGCKTSITAGSLNINSDCGDEAEDAVSKNDFGLVGGAGLAMSAAGRELSLQARYTKGLKNLATQDDQNGSNGSKVTNSVFSILLGIAF